MNKAETGPYEAVVVNLACNGVDDDTAAELIASGARRLGPGERLCVFDHVRSFSGLARLLRDAGLAEIQLQRLGPPNAITLVVARAPAG